MKLFSFEGTNNVHTPARGNLWIFISELPTVFFRNLVREEQVFNQLLFFSKRMQSNVITTSLLATTHYVVWGSQSHTFYLTSKKWGSRFDCIFVLYILCSGITSERFSDVDETFYIVWRRFPGCTPLCYFFNWSA